MASIQKSMRMTKEMATEIQNIVQVSGKDFSTVTKELLTEAIKMRRCPGVLFSEGVDGRRARIAGSGIEVWEVIENFLSMNEDFERLQAAYEWLSAQQLHAAILYNRLYPDEINALIERNTAWTKECMLENHPWLEGKPE